MPLELAETPTPAHEVTHLPTVQTLALDVGGMKCAGCVRVVEQALTKSRGVTSAVVNLATEVARVEYNPSLVTPDALAQTLSEAGFPAQPRTFGQRLNESHQTNLAEQRRQELRQQYWNLAIALVLLLLSVVGHVGEWFGISWPWLSDLRMHAGLATAALIFPGRAMLVEGWQGIQRRSPNMNTLVSLGAVTAYVTSLVALAVPRLGWECFFDEPVMIVGFILLGRTLEQIARNRAALAFRSLLSLQPRVARLVPPQTISPEHLEHSSVTAATAIEIPADAVRVGEWIQVLAGDRIPVDGNVVVGQTLVDESMLTGESMPILKQPGDPLAAGTVNQSGAIVMQANRTGQDTTLAQIIALVEAAQTRKAPIQKLVDQVAGYFTYGVLAIAALTFGFWYGLGTRLYPQVLQPASGMADMGHGMVHHFTHLTQATSPLLLSLKLAIAVLVVACPCALGLATPTALLVGSGVGAEQGLLIRGGDVLERVHRLDTIVLDKTGTLTTGKPEVTDCQLIAIDAANTLFSSQQTLTPTQFLQIAATVESGTRHPLAAAILAEASRQGLAPLPARDWDTQPGLGVAAIVTFDDQTELPVQFGSLAWLTQHQVVISEDVHVIATATAQAGKMVAYGAIAGHLVGFIAAIDTLRADAAETVTALQQQGLRVIMLTGDHPTVAAPIAQSLGLDPNQVIAGIQPSGKAQVIADLQQQGHQVAMVGDGINDAPALAQAHIGISLCSSTDVAMETAEIILMRDRLKDVVRSIQLSRSTFNKIRQNLLWAISYNVVGIPIAAGILLPSLGFSLSPATAGLLMALSSVSVVFNSLLLYVSVPSASPP